MKVIGRFCSTKKCPAQANAYPKRKGTMAETQLRVKNCVTVGHAVYTVRLWVVVIDNWLAECLQDVQERVE